MKKKKKMIRELERIANALEALVGVSRIRQGSDAIIPSPGYITENVLLCADGLRMAVQDGE